MRAFTDGDSQEWRINVSVGTIRRVREQTGVMLSALFDQECKLLAELSADCVQLASVLWCVCEQQADERGINEDQFAELLGGDTLGAAGEALVRATADFFTSPEQRKAVHAGLDVMNQTALHFLADAETKMRRLNPAQLAANCLHSVTSGPGSPELTQTIEPSANFT